VEKFLSESNQPTRKSVRLPDYDYGQPGLYFITICTHDKACLFGNVVDSEMEWKKCGMKSRSIFAVGE
jgi:hypothetical protein